ncbi:MAG: class I SAM-dependent methyltransferase [Acidobacteriota bacterium]
MLEQWTRSGAGRRCWFAGYYDRFLARLEQVLQPTRRDLVSNAGSSVLELGFGTGANWAVRETAPARYVGLEPDAAMLEVARRKFPRLPWLVQGEGEFACFPREAFDTVLVTLALCSVADPRRVLQESYRVLAPGGCLLYLEHVRGRAFRGRLQDLLTPIWRLPACGCHLNRETERLIQAVGFRIERRQVLVPPLQFLPAPVRWLGGLVGPWVAGVARRP